MSEDKPARYIEVHPIGPTDVAARLARSLLLALEELHEYRPCSIACEDKYNEGLALIAKDWSDA